ncbi:hypothetical protein LP420_36260 [Massilia sp. B-10]|nr:hypothetical protein LP420_36260 [Massilia sp. B-10]
MALGGWPLAQAAVAPRLRVVTAHLPPLVVENGGKRPGALHEVVVELCLGAWARSRSSNSCPGSAPSWWA